MIGSPRLARAILSAALFALLSSASAGLAEEGDLPQWVPSLGLGVGFQAREIDASLDAILETDVGPPIGNTAIKCGVLLIPSLCDFSDQDTRTADGAAFNSSAQLLGPSLGSLPLRPRPFVHGGYAMTFDSRTLVETGYNPSSFQDLGTEPRVRTRMRSNPEYLWYVGGGVALQLPLEFTPVFVKLGGHYSEDRADAIASVTRGFVNTENVWVPVVSEVTEEMKIPGAGPSVGIEAEIWRFGPVALQFVADVMFSFPLSDTDAEIDVDEPLGPGEVSCKTDPNDPTCVAPARFHYDADSLHYFGVASLRFAWVGY